MLELITLDPEFHRLFNLLSAHQVMLADELRVARFARAILETVKEGDVVVDLGTGTGILAFLAIKAGAKRVHAIERNDIIHLAQEVANANGWGDRIIFHKADALQVTLPERADVVISETIGHMGLAEDFVENMVHARRSFLKEGGVLMPCSVSVYVAPVECQEAHNQVSFWEQRPWGIDFSPLASRCRKQVYIRHFPETDILALPAQLAFFDLYCAQSSNVAKTVAFEIEAGTEIHGYCGWFQARLSADIVLETSPFSSPTHWEQTYFPINSPLHIKTPTNISVAFRFDGSVPEWKWETLLNPSNNSRGNRGSLLTASSTKQTP